MLNSLSPNRYKTKTFVGDSLSADDYQIYHATEHLAHNKGKLCVRSWSLYKILIINGYSFVLSND